MTNISPLSKLKRVPLGEAWKHEALDFTPWLAEDDNLQALAEALGISELELVATEHEVGDFKLDILCTDGDQQVVIEGNLSPRALRLVEEWRLLHQQDNGWSQLGWNTRHHRSG